MWHARVVLTILLINLLALFLAIPKAGAIEIDQKVARWTPTVKREGQAVLGINSPTPMFLGQIKQESGGREKVTAWDGGMGLTQFMPATVTQVSKSFPELGVADPYNPTWAIRAQTRYMHWIYKRVAGDNACERWAASLKGYNAGPGYVQRAQKKSETPGIWFTKTEYIPSGQSAENFEYSRTYPRKILLKHQILFTQYGHVTCLPYSPK